uniref:SFRICE_033659 n=1 Tax=Spodoptera frugiperda TaxID=7108 RepID=A0A2H1VEB2_SPOFR
MSMRHSDLVTQRNVTQIQIQYAIAFPRLYMGAGANGPGGRRALELILSGGLKSLARPAKPVRRAASRDSVLSQPQPLLEGLRKCSTVLALTDREKSSEPMRAHNRLRAPSVCSRCSSLLSLAGAGGSR